MAQLCFHERVGEGSDSLKMECLPQLCSAAIHTLKNASVSHVNSRSLAVCIQVFCSGKKMTAIFFEVFGRRGQRLVVLASSYIGTEEIAVSKMHWRYLTNPPCYRRGSDGQLIGQCFKTFFFLCVYHIQSGLSLSSD